jgi:hypothetical protein
MMSSRLLNRYPAFSGHDVKVLLWLRKNWKPPARSDVVAATSLYAIDGNWRNSQVRVMR